MTKREMRRALALGAPLIGINNRDLRDLSIDLSTTERLAGLAPDRLLVSESGIVSRRDVDRLSGRVDAFLIGSSLMGRANRRRRRESSFSAAPRSAVSTAAPMLRAARPAAFAGFVFVPGSPRHVTAEQAAPLAGTARQSGILPSGFSATLRSASSRTSRLLLNLHAVQLHGHEDVDYVRTLRRELQGSCEIWTALSVGRERLTGRGGDRLVFDNADGGSGHAFDWRLVERHPELRRAVVAGGIGPQNARAARVLGAYAIDVGSALDERPGRKSAEKIAAFFETLRPGGRAAAARMRLNGRFGRFGGAYVPEILVPALEQLEAAFLDAQDDPAFAAELNGLLANYAGRPTPLTRCRNLPDNIYLKREDLLHGGAHKTNQVLGQGLVAKRMGKTRLIAETGAGQHGVATAIVGALMGFETLIYMGAEDVERQKLNVFRMELMGARVVPVESGGRTLKDAINEALRDWSASFENTHYLLGTAAGPHPFPTMVREFQRVIGREARAQMIEQLGRLPDIVVACVGGGSNAIGLFADFIDDDVRLIGVEAAGKGLNGEEHGATLLRGTPGILHGAETYVLQDSDGQIADTWSVSAGLDYPAVGPEHALLKDSGRAEYVGATDAEALAAFKALAEGEGILCAFESAHAVAHALKLAEGEPDSTILVGLSGRGDKDVAQARALLA